MPTKNGWLAVLTCRGLQTNGISVDQCLYILALIFFFLVMKEKKIPLVFFTDPLRRNLQLIITSEYILTLAFRMRLGFAKVFHELGWRDYLTKAAWITQYVAPRQTHVSDRQSRSKCNRIRTWWWVVRSFPDTTNRLQWDSHHPVWLRETNEYCVNVARFKWNTDFAC